MMSPPDFSFPLLTKNVLIMLTLIYLYLIIYHSTAATTKNYLPHSGRKVPAGMLLAPNVANLKALDAVKVSVDQLFSAFFL